MHQFLRTECLPSCLSMMFQSFLFFSLYYFTWDNLISLLPIFYFIFHWLQVNLFWNKNSAQGQFQFGCSICKHNLLYQLLTWILSLHTYSHFWVLHLLSRSLQSPLWNIWMTLYLLKCLFYGEVDESLVWGRLKELCFRFKKVMLTLLCT